ncbi:MAG: hypothetical protein A3E88_04865 [Legionellales bacterium RIFCSPHIGHO2_12_FULL_35_11]|nr:MAG: hypothetical protein A3E88_04865 [Legionellales bacterium RIFCSPHIGHO2_12_FULL_35_11]
MLQKLNERIQGAVAWVIIILITITFALFGLDYFLQSRRSSSTKAKVNGQEISTQDYEVQFRRTAQFQDSNELTASSDAELKHQVLHDMIVNLLSVQAAKSNGFSVDPQQANSAIASIPQFQENGHFSNLRYSQALHSALYTPQSFQKEVQDGMIVNQQRFALIGTEFVLPNEIEKFVKLYLQKRDYSYLTIPAALFIDKVNITNSEIADYYAKHKDDFLSAEKISLEYIQLSMNSIKNTISITDEQMHQYYDDNKQNFLTPAKWKVAHILLSTQGNNTTENDDKLNLKAQDLSKELQSFPDKFSEKIKLLSADQKSADGVLPWIVAGNSKYDKYFIDFTEVGQISNPIKTKSGYEIFKLVEYKPSVEKPFSEVQSLIKEQMAADIAQNKYTDSLEKLTDLSYQTPDSLDQVSSALNIPIKHTDMFDRNGGDTEFLKNSKILAAAFNKEVLDGGNNSEPVQLDNDSVVVLRVKDHISASTMQLDNVKSSIKNQLIMLKAKEDALKFSENLLNHINLTKDVDFDNKKLAWKEAHQVSRDSTGIDTSINDLAFSIPNIGESKGLSLEQGDYAIVHISNITDGDFDKLDKEQVAIIRQQLESSYGLNDYNLYTNGLMMQAKIVRN